ncbi:uncharacterized protein CTRU02_202896 [Colletotrichum truncatum]|uniref:Uncharacterized protein n=1 Tax=Colletotrichum truncatum TaxID=5467 RepID=A0ACC3ZLN2_COLTU|nr:uncharacterized protein CTRU02_12988 [Colletotrichum truncatum]KAF6783972.1 hypothetical protein CTRU02_12988 [Colletotrichum truncatum]
MQHHFPVPHQHSSSTYFTPATKSATQSDFLSPRFSLSPPISSSLSIILHITGPVLCFAHQSIPAHHTSVGFSRLRKFASFHARRSAKAPRDLWACYH